MANRQQNDNNQQLLADECGPANDLHASPARRLANVVAEGHGFLASSSVSSQRTRCPGRTSVSVTSSTGRTVHRCPSHSCPDAPRTLFLLLYLMIVIVPQILVTTNEHSQNWCLIVAVQNFWPTTCPWHKVTQERRELPNKKRGREGQKKTDLKWRGSFGNGRSKRKAEAKDPTKPRKSSREKETKKKREREIRCYPD